MYGYMLSQPIIDLVSVAGTTMAIGQWPLWIGVSHHCTDITCIQMNKEKQVKEKCTYLGTYLLTLGFEGLTLCSKLRNDKTLVL